MNFHRLCLIAALFAACSSTAFAQDAELFKDINTTFKQIEPQGLIQAGNFVFFTADDRVNGRELWRSDGTAGGTFMLKDLNPGAAGSQPSSLTKLGSNLIFSADDGALGRELYRSDGTTAGTILLIDLNLSGDGMVQGASMASASDTRAFFAGNDGTNGIELFTTNGTALGTGLVEDINDGTLSSTPRMLGKIGTKFLFSAETEDDGRELWATEAVGTPNAGNTVLVADIFAGSPDSDPAFATVLDDILLFEASNFANGRELWKSDGLTAELVKDINPGPGTSRPIQHRVLNNKIIFRANDGVTGNEPWVSDGTLAGTILLKDINPTDGSIGTFAGSQVDATKLVFRADDGVEGEELWVTNGTPAETDLLKVINPGSAGSNPTEFERIGNSVFFHATDKLRGDELWKTDASTGGTVPVVDLVPGPAGARPLFLTILGSNLIFSGFNGVDFALFKSNGSAVGTAEIKNLSLPGAGTRDAFPGSFLVFGNSFCFRGFREGFQSSNFFCSDGTPNGTIELGIVLNPLEGRVIVPSFLGGDILFTASDEENGIELWRSDRLTGAGTILVKDIETAGNGNSFPDDYVEVNGVVLFQAQQNNESKLFRTDGTEAGTVSVANINPGGNDQVSDLTILNNNVIFQARDAVFGQELWKSDGTQFGTQLIKDINPFGDAGPSGIKAFQGALFFSADNGINGRELWRTDGTTSGTNLAVDINPAGSGSPFQLTPLGNRLFFTAISSVDSGVELHVSDGTPGGTSLVKDINPGPSSGNINKLVAGKALVYFVASDGLKGQELWRSDGTPDGTFLLRDIRPGAGDGEIQNLTPVNELLYFSAQEDASGDDLWRTDGTVAGTVKAFESNFTDDIGIAIGINEMFSVNGDLYFTLSDPIAGGELFVLRDECKDDIVKFKPGVCGCGLEDADLNANGAIDCLAGPEFKVRLAGLKAALRKLKPLVGRKAAITRQRALRRALKADSGAVKNFVAEVGSQIIITSDKVSLNKLVAKLHKLIRKLASASAADFKAAKKAANKGISAVEKVLG